MEEGDGWFHFPSVVIVESACQLYFPKRAFSLLLGRQSHAGADEEYEEFSFFHAFIFFGSKVSGYGEGIQESAMYICF